MKTESKAGPRRFLVFTGDGKGKTTAALGMVLRAIGHGQRVNIVQFLKNDSTTGELEAIRYLPGTELVQTGLGFVPAKGCPAFQRHKEAAEKGLQLASNIIEREGKGLLILDELCSAVSLGLLDELLVLSAIETAGPELCVVATGRNATARIIAAADTVTEMRCIKHAFQQGRAAEPGVEM